MNRKLKMLAKWLAEMKCCETSPETKQSVPKNLRSRQFNLGDLVARLNGAESQEDFEILVMKDYRRYQRLELYRLYLFEQEMSHEINR